MSNVSSMLRVGRFTLVLQDDINVDELSYVTSWDTWEQAEIAFDDGRMPLGFRLIDNATGRVWHPGARYEWEDAQT